ncbi:hypothetical protein CI610_01874 [invertebrate metagenome]|uniref:Uncharacterized protein n=1 Tax=invertebrate metagenome TaxID=1711999 RepID=A0A2H9T7E1_9ZZZZ
MVTAAKRLTLTPQALLPPCPGVGQKTKNILALCETKFTTRLVQPEYSFDLLIESKPIMSSSDLSGYFPFTHR